MMHYTNDELSKHLQQLEASPHRPSDFDAARLRTHIEVAEVELKKLEIEITLLLAKRSQVMIHVNRCRSFLAPYNKLPPELIREIILFGMPTQKYAYRLPFRYWEPQFCLRMTQICTSWRRVAFSMPEFSSVHLEYHIEKPSCIKLASSLLSQCLAPRFVLTTSHEFDVPFTELISPYSHKFKSLSLPIRDAIH